MKRFGSARKHTEDNILNASRQFARLKYELYSAFYDEEVCC